MRTKLFLVLLFSVPKLYSQNISEDDKGSGTILFPVGNISFNTTDTRLKVGYIHGVPSSAEYIKSIDTANHFKPVYKVSKIDSINLSNRWILGGFVSGTNDDGTASLLGDGELTAGAGAEAILGLKWYWRKTNMFKTYKTFNDSNELRVKFAEDHTKLMVEANTLMNDMLYFADAERALLKSDPNTDQDTAIVDPVIKQIKLLIKIQGLDSLRREVAKLNEICSTALAKLPQSGSAHDGIDAVKGKNANLTIVVDKITDRRSRLKTMYKAQRSSVDAMYNAGSRNHFMSAYVDFKVDRRVFNLYQSPAIAGSNYTETKFTGYKLTLNLNYYVPHTRMAFGGAVGYQLTDNYDTLSTMKFQTVKLIYQDSLRTDKTTKDINVTKGKYFRYRSFPIMLDATWMFPNEDKSKVVALGAYYRYNIPVLDPENIVSPDWKFGVSVNLFKTDKALFVNGLYVQVGNAKAGVHHKTEVADMFTLGITTKINLIRFDYRRMFPDNE